MKKPRLTHPNLYLGIMIFGVWGMALGLSSILTNPKLPFAIPQLLFGGIYITLGLMKIIGINTRFLKLARLGMTGCMVYSIFVGLSYAVLYFQHSVGSLNGAILFIGFGVIQMSAIQEPTTNPLSEKVDGWTPQ